MVDRNVNYHLAEFQEVTKVIAQNLNKTINLDTATNFNGKTLKIMIMASLFIDI